MWNWARKAKSCLSIKPKSVLKRASENGSGHRRGERGNVERNKMILIIRSPHFINRTLLQSSRINVCGFEGAWIIRLEPLTVFGSATSVVILRRYLICLACLIFSDDSSSVKIQICYAVFKDMYSVMPTFPLPPSLHYCRQRLSNFHASTLSWTWLLFYLWLFSASCSS